MGPLIGLIDRRGDLYIPRQALLDREPLPLSRGLIEELWADLDEHCISEADKSMKGK